MKKFLLIFALLVSLGAGCVTNNIITLPVACTTEAKLCPDGSAVGRTGPNCEFEKCPVTNALTIIRLLAATVSTTIEYSAVPKYVSKWASGGEEVIINGGFFNQDFTPSGYLVIGGKRIGKRMFNQGQSGLLVIKNNVVTIRDLSIDPISKNETFDYALQSYPFLITSSTPALTRDTGLVARRTAVGTDTEGNIYLIVSNNYLSLYQFMKQILAENLPLVSVLNLDGGPSTGMYSALNTKEILVDSIVPVPFVVKIYKK